MNRLTKIRYSTLGVIGAVLTVAIMLASNLQKKTQDESLLSICKIVLLVSAIILLFCSLIVLRKYQNGDSFFDGE